MARSSRRRPSSSGGSNASKAVRSGTVFERRNYVLLLVGVALVVVGFAAMYLDGQVESFVSLYLAPLLILGGYLEVIYAILWRPSGEAASKKDSAAEAGS